MPGLLFCPLDRCLILDCANVLLPSSLPAVWQPLSRILNLFHILGICFEGYVQYVAFHCGHLEFLSDLHHGLLGIPGAKMGETGTSNSQVGAGEETPWSSSLLDSLSTQPIPEEEYIYRAQDLWPFSVNYPEASAMPGLD